MVFNDEQKNDIAWQEYTKYKVGNKVKIDTDNKKQTIGYVSEVFGQATRKRIWSPLSKTWKHGF